MNSQQSICVIGSVNADISIRVPRFVRPGETLKGRDFQFSPGGKGANQAVAAARLGATGMSARPHRNATPSERTLRTALRSCGVNCAGLERDATLSTGSAVIQVEEGGQNAICIAAGANDTVTPDYLHRVKRLLDEASIVLLQLEIPMDTVIWAAEYCAGQGKLVMLDPAPAAPLSEELLRHVGIITPNETELREITGIEVSDAASRRQACRALLTLGVKTVINKAGADGVYVYTGDELMHYPTYDVPVVDTTAAGDSFNGGLAYALACGMPFAQAVDEANLVASLSTTGFGAQSAMPTRLQLEQARQTLRHKA